jgi:SAM-dependent methyltransferase
VPYVPTPYVVVERMLEIARVGPGDFLADLGSGDGRIVITAAKKFGARGFGVDLDPARIKDSNDNARRAGVADKVTFYQRNLFDTDLGSATVITLYLLPRVNLDLRPRLLDLKPGTRLVSHDFDMGDWLPDTHVNMPAEDKYAGTGGSSDIYFWVVPAKVAGVWQWELQASGKPLAYELKLDQRYQRISGSVSVGGRPVKLQEARLRGGEISFGFTADVNGSPVKHQFTGKVAGDTVAGSARLSGTRLEGQHDWSARRTGQSAAAGPGAGWLLSAAAH